MLCEQGASGGIGRFYWIVEQQEGLDIFMGQELYLGWKDEKIGLCGLSTRNYLEKSAGGLWRAFGGSLHDMGQYNPMC